MRNYYFLKRVIWFIYRKLALNGLPVTHVNFLTSPPQFNIKIGADQVTQEQQEYFIPFLAFSEKAVNRLRARGIYPQNATIYRSIIRVKCSSVSDNIFRDTAGYRTYDHLIDDVSEFTIDLQAPKLPKRLNE